VDKNDLVMRWLSSISLCSQVGCLVTAYIGVRNQEEIGSSSLDIYTGTWPGHWYDYTKDSFPLGHCTVSPGEWVSMFQKNIVPSSRWVKMKCST
jgi:hypothetical protein